MSCMNSIIISIFLLLVLPYAGLPRVWDVYLVLLILGWMAYSLYRFISQHNVRFVLPGNDEDDFLEQNKDEISPQLETVEDQE